MEIKNEQFGVKLERRGEDDPHVCFQIFSDASDSWRLSIGNSFSSYWLDDLIQVLQTAKTHLEKACKKQADGYGYEFKE